MISVTLDTLIDVAAKLFEIEVRDSPHGIFGSCTRYPRGLTRWAELLGRRRRRRRQLVLPGGYRPSDPPPCLISKEQVLAQKV